MRETLAEIIKMILREWLGLYKNYIGFWSTINSSMLIDFKYYIVFSSTIFIGGIISILFSKNIINWLISIELLFISSIINFVIFSLYYWNVEGFIYALIVIILAAAEAALGLSIIAIFYNNNKNINIYPIKEVKI